MANVDRCICCGEIIPEGRMACPNCLVVSKSTGKRLIDANVLKAGLDNLEVSGGHVYYRKGMDDVLHKFLPSFIDEQTTVDAVEVVRCKDCKHYRARGTHGNSAKWDCKKLMCCRSANISVKPDDFCSYGERRGENNGP